MADRTCATCGAPTERKSANGPYPKTCSDECRRRRRTAIAIESRPPRQPPTSTRIKYDDCVDCGACFVLRGRSARCANCRRLRRNEQMLRYMAEHKERTGQRYTAKYQEKRRLACAAYARAHKVECTCQQCGTTWQAKRENARFCSRACYGNSLRLCRLPVLHPDPSPVSHLSSRHPARRTPPSLPTPVLFVAGHCARCCDPFVVAHQMQSRYCSDRCSKADAKDRGRARKRGGFVAPVYRSRIFERDGWRCQICKKRVKRTAVAPHPLAPVLDHITPLADGGTHEPVNVQCAHFLCNSRKGHRSANDQLRLIG